MSETDYDFVNAVRRRAGLKPMSDAEIRARQQEDLAAARRRYASNLDAFCERWSGWPGALSRPPESDPSEDDQDFVNRVRVRAGLAPRTSQEIRTQREADVAFSQRSGRQDAVTEARKTDPNEDDSTFINNVRQRAGLAPKTDVPIALSQPPRINLSDLRLQQKFDATMREKRPDLGNLYHVLTGAIRRSSPGRDRRPWEGPVRKAYTDWAAENLDSEFAELFQTQRLPDLIERVLNAIFGSTAPSASKSPDDAPVLFASAGSAASQSASAGMDPASRPW